MRKPTPKMKSLLHDLKRFSGPFSVDFSSKVAYQSIWGAGGGNGVYFTETAFWGLVDRGLLERCGPCDYIVA